MPTIQHQSRDSLPQGGNDYYNTSLSGHTTYNPSPIQRLDRNSQGDVSDSQIILQKEVFPQGNILSSIHGNQPSGINSFS